MYFYRKTKSFGIENPNRALVYLSIKWQKMLYRIGIAWHNTIRNECTRDFNCCTVGIGKKAWFRLSHRKPDVLNQRQKEILGSLIEACDNDESMVLIDSAKVDKDGNLHID